MKAQTGTIPAEAVKGIATGLLMMACFTLIWSGIAFSGLHTSPVWLVLLIFPVLSAIFINKSIKLYKVAGSFPAVESEEDKAEEKRIGKWFGITFGAEGLGIFIAINVVNNLGHPELDIPAIALIVGLHFYPLGWIFKRSVDYYLATYTTLIAVLAIVLSLNHTLSFPAMMAFTGTGLAISTSCYGLYMMRNGNKITG